MTKAPDDPKVSAERVRTLLARWQLSLELHSRYLTLDDAHYWHVQPWPPHERPAAWIVRLARQKVAELARTLAERNASGDLAFAAGLEQMLFLANLVGLQPAGRHLPLADPQNEQSEILPTAGRALTDTVRVRSARVRARAHRAPPPATSRAGKSSAASSTHPAMPPVPAAARPVLEDAIRLLQWGRKWHELGELIAKLPQRPSVGDTRRILRTHRARIEAAASASAD